MGEILDRIYQYSAYVLLGIILILNSVIGLILNDVRYYFYSKRIRRSFYGRKQAVHRFSRRKG